MSSSLSPGTKLGRYEIVTPLGPGGMGEVYLAEDAKLNRRIALKILPTEFCQDNQRAARFLREAQAASALNHPNICTIYEINGCAYGLAGKRNEALTVLNQLLEMRGRQYADASNIARVYAGLGNSDKAFEWLEKAVEERTGIELVFLTD